MACPHLSAQFITRGSGHSAVEASAYRARAVMHDERTGETHDYTRARSRCIFEGIYAPKDAPEWAHDRSKLWNHVEAFEKHRRAELAQEINIALPHELTLEQNRRLLQDWVRENFTRKGLIADVAIHEPDGRGDARNIHAHVMVVRRKLDGSEFVRTKERYDTFGEKQAAKEADLLAMRQSWEKLANRHLERYGHEARIDMGRKQDGEASLHMGKRATAQERRGMASELGDINREIAAGNARRRQAANENAPDFTTTLDGVRQREQRTAGPSRSTEHEARRAMDDLARTDPHGTARHFGHHAGDRLKTPEDMRREQAERLRSFATEPTRDSASPDPGRERTRQRQTWMTQAHGWDGLSPENQRSARQSWQAWSDKRDPADTRPAFTLSQYVDHVQTREAKKRSAEPARPSPIPTPEPIQRHQANATRDDLAARPVRAAGVTPQRAARGPDPVSGPTTPVERPRPATASQERPGASYLRAALSSARERLNSLGARLESVRAAIMTRGSSRLHDARTGGGMAREDNSSRKVNADAAAEQRAAEREAKAREAASRRDTARDHDRQQHSQHRQEEKRVRRSIWEEDMRRAELEAAAEQLRRALERPGEHDHSRERKP